MATDIRIKVGFGTHPKTRKLIRRVGGDGAFRLVMLWAWAAANKPTGDLAGMTDEDIELAADWQGEPDAFVQALVDVRFLDGEPGERALHDWTDHNPYAAGSSMRSEAGKKAANKRWKKKGWDCGGDAPPKKARKAPDAGGDGSNDALREGADGCGSDADRIKSHAVRMDPQCGSHESALPIASKGNAPSPTPSPTPTPTPIPTTEARNTHHAPKDAREVVCEPDQGEVTEIRPEVRAALALRKRGLAINAMHPDLVDAVGEGVTIAELDAMAEAYPDKPAGYVIAAARRQHAEVGRPAHRQRAGPVTAAAPSKTRQAIQSILGDPGHDRPEPAAITHSAVV